MARAMMGYSRVGYWSISRAVEHIVYVRFSQRRFDLLKGVSSRMLRQERPDIAQCYFKDGLWSPSYWAASCGGVPISIIRQTIEQQQTPD